MAEQVEFSFRVWVHPEDGDPADIEVWFYGLEPTLPNRCFVSDWARESLCNENFHTLFELDKDKHWQVVGKGTLRGWYDYWGEYDEEFDVIEYEKAEVPEEWLRDDGMTLNEEA